MAINKASSSFISHCNIDVLNETFCSLFYVIFFISLPRLKSLKGKHLFSKLKKTWGFFFPFYLGLLTHWGRVTHICVIKLTISGSDNGLSPDRRQAIIWTNAGILLIGPLGTNLSEILIEIYTFSLKKMHLKISSAKWRPFWLGLNVLNTMVV